MLYVLILLVCVAFTHVRLRPDQLRLTAIECLGEVYLDERGDLKVKCDGVLRVYAVLFSPFGGVNSPPCFLDLSLALARCCVMNGALTARIYVDDGYGSGLRVAQPTRCSIMEELTAKEALKFWCSLCAFVHMELAPHKVELDYDMGLLGLFVSVSRNRVERGERNRGRIRGACEAVCLSVEPEKTHRGKTVSVLHEPLSTVYHASLYSCEVVVGTKAFLGDLGRQLVRNLKRKCHVHGQSCSGVRADISLCSLEDVHWQWVIAPRLDTMEILTSPPSRVHHFLDVGVDASYEPESMVGGYGIQCYGEGVFGSFSSGFMNDLKAGCSRPSVSEGDRAQQYIMYLELWTVLRLLQLFGPVLAGSTVHFSEDNMAVYYCILKLDARASVVSVGIMKSIVMLCYLHRIVLAPEWRCSERNVIPDVLSGVLNGGRSAQGGVSDVADKLSVAEEMFVQWHASRGEGVCETRCVRDVRVSDVGYSVLSRAPLYDALGWCRPPCSLNSEAIAGWACNVVDRG